MDRYDAPVQTMLTGPSRVVFAHEARRRGLTTSALARMVLTEWMEANVTDADLRTFVEDAAKTGRAAVEATRPPVIDPALQQFVAAHCRTDGAAIVPIGQLWSAWQTWANDHETNPGRLPEFTRRLRQVVPHVAVYRPRHSPAGTKVRHYRGLALQ